jgi:ABC-2 type transport system ATP-binding protein
LDYPNVGTATIDGKHYASLAYPMREVGALLDAKAVHGGRSAYNHLLSAWPRPTTCPGSG